ncbi:MAG: zf-HC2 domain-containing protein [Oscillospiraceae bacterium]|nr:zf-HC2 domain-containing protein [Oscillospiraceae bacterium]
MSNCTKYQDMISSYIDGELTFAEKRELTEHVAACPSCRTMFEAYSAIFGNLGETMAEPPESLKERVMSAIGASRVQYVSPVAAARAPKVKKKSLKWTRYALAAACLAVIIFTVPKVVNSAPKMADSAVNKSEQISEAEESAAPNNNAYTNEDPQPDQFYGNADATEMNGENKSDEPNESVDGNAKNTGTPEDVPEETGSEAPTEQPRRLCTVRVSGERPEILAGYELTDNGDGSYTISISKEVADALAEMGYSISYSGEGGDDTTDYIVIFMP